MNLLQELSLGNCPRGSLHCAFSASVDGGGPVAAGGSASGAYVVCGAYVVAGSAGSPGDSDELGLYRSVDAASVGCTVLGGTVTSPPPAGCPGYNGIPGCSGCCVSGYAGITSGSSVGLSVVGA